MTTAISRANLGIGFGLSLTLAAVAQDSSSDSAPQAQAPDQPVMPGLEDLMEQMEVLITPRSRDDDAPVTDFRDAYAVLPDGRIISFSDYIRGGLEAGDLERMPSEWQALFQTGAIASQVRGLASVRPGEVMILPSVTARGEDVPVDPERLILRRGRLLALLGLDLGVLGTRPARFQPYGVVGNYAGGLNIYPGDDLYGPLDVTGQRSDWAPVRTGIYFSTWAPVENDDEN